MSFLKKMTLGPVKEVHFVFLRLPGNCCSCSELKRMMRYNNNSKLTSCLLCVRSFYKYLIDVNSFSPDSNSMRQVLLPPHPAPFVFLEPVS